MKEVIPCRYGKFRVEPLKPFLDRGSTTHTALVLEEEKYADIAVIDRNLFTVESSEFLSVQVLLTVMDGTIVFER